MDLAEYQQWVADTAQYPPGLDYPAETLASEAGEVLGCVIKAKRRKQDHEIHPTDFTAAGRAALELELSDVLWALAATCNELGVSLAGLAATNHAKLTERARDGTLYSAT